MLARGETGPKRFKVPIQKWKKLAGCGFSNKRILRGRIVWIFKKVEGNDLQGKKLRSTWF
jgi:hypothetical protein